MYDHLRYVFKSSSCACVQCLWWRTFVLCSWALGG